MVAKIFSLGLVFKTDKGSSPDLYFILEYLHWLPLGKVGRLSTPGLSPREFIWGLKVLIGRKHGLDSK